MVANGCVARGCSKGHATRDVHQESENAAGHSRRYQGTLNSKAECSDDTNSVTADVVRP